MATMGDLYRQARQMCRDRQAAVMNKRRADATLVAEIDQLKHIMALVLNAYKQAGGAKAD